jgi:hypothetical protein
VSLNAVDRVASFEDAFGTEDSRVALGYLGARHASLPGDVIGGCEEK